ncbi:MAG: ATP-binding protein [Hyphomicrobiaceae bacterium]|nr:ATP-binding protein [Hyphomicrobiaceae bacterium]
MNTSLAVRIALAVAIAFLAISVVATAYVLRRSDINAQASIPSPAKVAAMADLLDDLPEQARVKILPALSTPLLDVSLEATPAREVSLSPLEDRQLSVLLEAYRAAMPARDTWLDIWRQDRPMGGLPRLLRREDASLVLRTTLQDSKFMVLRSRELFPVTNFGLPLGFGAGLLGTLIAVLMLVFLLRQIRPLEELARAVDRIDLRDVPQPIPAVSSSAPEIRALVTAFNRQQERLSGLLKSRLALVGGLQHDVRTFATKVRLRLESEPASASLNKAISDLDDMVRLLDDALLATQGTETSTDDGLELVDIRELLILEKDARPDQKITLETMAGVSPPRLYVLGNRLALRRVFSNLIDNAVTYGQEARIAVASGLGRVVVTIDDSGPGIPTKMRDIVREPFVRLERSRARATGGSGLGLAIVSNLVGSHEGRFTISDAPGGGARMTIDLPQFSAERAR